jgi:hypothetical protein
MLVQLISADQVVLLYDTSETYLFYSGEVYEQPRQSGFKNLPENHRPHFPVWALIDMDFGDRGPPITSSSDIWPVQASSNSVQWKSWSKQFGAAELGMPLWNMEELMKGYVSSFFSLSAIDPGHVVQQRFVAESPSPFPQFTSSAPV